VDGEIVVERELARPFSVEQVGKPERWFALDSTLEQSGFELWVPPACDAPGSHKVRC
jgi:hypothetical protein